MAPLIIDNDDSNGYVLNTGGFDYDNDPNKDLDDHVGKSRTSPSTICGIIGNESPSETSRAPKVPSQKPIAICGMSVRLPGGLHSPQQLWDFLIARGDARGSVPDSRYNASAYYSGSEMPIPGSIKSEYGYFLDESIDLASIDTSFFSMGKVDVERMDPHQRQMLEVARESLEDAGVNWKGRPIGCYMGSFGEDWVEMFAKENQQYGLYRVTGYGDFMLSNRISYEMDLTGPSMVIRTGCSAALVALHEACMAISRGDCEGAIVGGANLILAPGMTTAMTEQGVPAPDGSCKTFSADANGYARGEAVSAIFIKPLAEAIRDGNPIRAVIRATASNSDGKGTGGGLQMPNDVTQEAMIRRAYEVAGIPDYEYSQTAFVECHGTGTSIGEPIETRAIGRVFGPSGGVQIGSVKPNLGHSEGASGLTSLIKSVLALEHRIIPPNIKFNKPNPDIPWDSGLSVPTEATPWPNSRRERVSVNSFGIGGTNAHVILDSAQSFGVSPIPNQPMTSPQLFVYSANNADSLNKMILNYRDYAQNHPGRVNNLAFTLAKRREHLPYRAFAVADLFGGITASLPFRSSGGTPSIVMVFTGQGAQWPEMGRCMILSSAYPIFKKSIRSLDSYVRSLKEDAPEWTIEEELQKPIETSRLGSAEFSQPLCTAIQIALVDTFASVGIQPDAVVGHSSGEIAAAYAAGAITAREAIIIAFYRGLVTKMQTSTGAMAAIGLGSESALELAMIKIKEAHPDIRAKKLQVDRAYHSHHMAEIGDKYHALIEDHTPSRSSKRTLKKLFFSSVEGKLLTQESNLESRYWQRNLESPVLFRSAISSIIQHGIAKNMVFLEVGPHSALASPLRQVQSHLSNTSPYVSTLVRNKNDVESFLTAIGKLYTFNASIDLDRVIAEGSTLPDLPRYPWDHSKKFWHESRLSKHWRHRPGGHKHHNLLGVRVVESLEFEVLFRNIFHLEHAAWIRDHKIGDDIIFPLAAYAGMVGEAVRQITGVTEAFKMRKVVVSTALALKESSQPVELMTIMRRHRLTDSLDSDWWEFTIASHSGTVSIKHCVGEARPHSGNAYQEIDIAPLMRRVDTRRCYRSMARSGLNFGPAVQRLSDIRSDTLTQKATSEVISKATDAEGYHLHPTIIDALLQLLPIAASRGYADPTTKMMVPTNIEELCIYRCHEDVQVRASASYTPNGSIIGDGQCVSNGKLVLRGSGIRLSVLDDQSGKADETTARAEWGPHIDFMNVNTLILPSIDRSAHVRALKELCHMCMVHTSRVIAGLDTPMSHMRKYRSWIDQQLQLCDFEYHGLDNPALEERVKCIVHDLSQTIAAAPSKAIQKIFSSAEKIFTGELEALDLLLSDGTMDSLYASIDQCDESQFFEHLAHSKPNLRVLEIGAGLGGSTANALRFLTPGGRTLYSNYTFTDISPGFFSAAKGRFGLYPNMEYATLDISKDPAEQGFDGLTYDLILATNVIHATPHLKESLKNVRKLLAPSGRLLLHELAPTPTSKWVNYIWGTLAGWWNGEADDRVDEPYVDVHRWVRELKAAGFRTPDAIVLDSPEPYQLGAVIALENRGYVVDCRGLFDMPLAAGQDVIAFLDDEAPFFENINHERFESFKSLVENMEECGIGILWVTGLLQIECRDPRSGQINGIARSIRSEKLVDLATCEVDDVDSDSSREKIIDVFERFQLRHEDHSLKPEFEYAIVKHTVQVARIHTFPVHGELLTSAANDVIALRTIRPGSLSALHWACQKIEQVMEGDDVEINIHSTGLNFRDVLCAMGIVEASGIGFGFEAAGIVRRTGPNVKDLKAGDRVFLIGPGAFSTQVVVSENLCEKIPGDLSFEDAATMPCVFATSIYCMFNVGNLRKGQSILIHSACGGVGLASIQLAQMVGAEIYVTVGNEEKVKYVMDKFGLPRNRIFNSRDSSFTEHILRETDGGVDLALNSLSGELLHATWRCIAVFGKMIEIGKRDLIGSGKLDMSPFIENRSYCCVDLDQICSRRPIMLKQLLRSVVQLLRERYIQPIRPIKVFKADAILDAFRYMQQGIHLGKIVVSIRDSTGQADLKGHVQKRREPTQFASSGAYLLVGGLGGLGRSLSVWMAELGARNFIYLSRSAGANQEHLDFAQELASMGCRVDFVQGSVSDPGDVTKAITRAQAQGQLKGIFQMSMVNRDENLTRMTLEDWNEAVKPKVNGTWNLHNAALSVGAELDFFVLFSSLSGMFGQPGQSNYAGANTFLDAFSQYRLTLGLPACAISIGAVEEVGCLAVRESIMQRFKATGILGDTISVCELFQGMELAIKPTTNKSSNNFCIGLRSRVPLNDPENRALWKKDIRTAVFHNKATGNKSSTISSEGLKSFITAAKSNPALLVQPDSAHLLAVEIGKKVFSFLLKSEDDLHTWCSLSDLGMDSLVAIEVRQWWKMTFEFDITPAPMYPTGRSRSIFVGALVAFILCSLFVAARLVSRFGIVKRYGWDDYTIIAAWILAFGMSFAVAFATFYGLGLPGEDILPVYVRPLLEARYAAIVLFNPALNVTKASILLLYIHIAQRPQRFLYIGSCVTLTVVLVGGVTFTFLTAFQCRPVKAVYDPSIKNSSCIHIETIDLAIVPVNVATDLSILVLPIPVLMTLHLPLGQKTVVLLIFILGVLLITAVDTVRIY
ncbi:Acyl transferase/acyl hydrolase/lysophospholipase [Penicillium sp. IBT 16267x]|nr:Acyl transferase/acyl hydrolase/lysophospholipase [Penicillium sp. IBT 16267x]